MIQPTETSARIQLLRDKCRRGEQLTQDEVREAINLLREGRTQAAKTSAASKARKSAAKAVPNSDDLLSELED